MRAFVDTEALDINTDTDLNDCVDFFSESLSLHIFICFYVQLQFECNLCK